MGTVRRRLSPEDRRAELLALGAEVFGKRPYDEVRIDEIAERAGAVGTPSVPTVVEAAEQLVDLAIKAGSPDNVTVIVVKVTTGGAVPAAGARRSIFRRG